MPRKTRPRPRPAPEPSASPTSSLTEDQLHRWADLIADGRDTLPDDLPPFDRERLRVAVGHRLRGRMVRLIARAIAARLRRQARSDTEAQTDA
jgi:hypothetical protein